ncbi:MAG: hypothetical protein K2Y27_17545, partial [Xanthobacteraceae bacterium]|nr:hypothetical protein [Xanthobacteraceae bacterium]
MGGADQGERRVGGLTGHSPDITTQPGGREAARSVFTQAKVRSGLPEHALEDRVDVLEVIAEIEVLLDLGG